MLVTLVLYSVRQMGQNGKQMVLELYAEEVGDELDAVLGEVSEEFVKLQWNNVRISFHMGQKILRYFLLHTPDSNSLKLITKTRVQVSQIFHTPHFPKNPPFAPRNNMQLYTIQFLTDALIQAYLSHQFCPQAYLYFGFLG